MNSYVAIGFVLCCSPVLVLVSGMPQFVGYSGQQQQQQAYLQQQISQPQPAYLTAGLLQQQPQGVYNDGQRAPQQFAPQLPTQRVPQLLLPTNVDRQVQKAAKQTGGIGYAQQIQQIQQQENANRAIAGAQRAAVQQVNIFRQQQEFEEQRRQQQYQPQPPHIQYIAQPQPQQPQYVQQGAYKSSFGGSSAPTRQRYQEQQEEEPEEHDTNASYQFGFDVKDDQYTNYQNRKEQREGGKITGSYSVVDSDGFIRTVTYTADPKEGFKAEVVRQPTDIVVKIPTPAPKQQPQYVQEVPQGQKQNIVYRYE